MTYDPRAFPEVRRSSAPSAPPPVAPPAPRVTRADAERTQHFRSLRRGAALFTLAVLASFGGLAGFVKSQDQPPPVAEPVRATFGEAELNLWGRTMAALAERKTAGAFPGFGGGLREFLAGDASRSRAVDDACRAAGWTRERFVAACFSVQIGLELTEAEAAGKRVFAGESDRAAQAVVAENGEDVRKKLEALR